MILLHIHECKSALVSTVGKVVGFYLNEEAQKHLMNGFDTLNTDL